MDTGIIEGRIELIDHLLDKLRCRALGGNAPCVLPLAESTHAEQKAYICSLAARLTFCYAAANPDADADKLRTFKARALAALTFLQYECNEDDQTFGSLLRLAALPSDNFCRVLQTVCHTPRRFRQCYRPPAGDSPPAEHMARAVLLLFANEDRLPGTDALRNALR